MGRSNWRVAVQVINLLGSKDMRWRDVTGRWWLRGPTKSHETLSMEFFQGLGSPWIVCSLWELVKLHNPALIYKSETKSKSRRYDSIKQKLNYFGVGIDFKGKSRGLLLVWKKAVNVWVQSFSAHHIDAIIRGYGIPNQWRFTRFYGHPETSKWKDSWILLHYLWICGDQTWASLFPNTQVQHDVEPCSNRVVLLLNLDVMAWKDSQRWKPEFRFEAVRIKSDEVSEIVAQSWWNGKGDNLGSSFCNKALSSMMLNEEQLARIHGASVSRQSPCISHLLFKSTAVFSKNIPKQLWEELSDFLWILMVAKHEKYFRVFYYNGQAITLYAMSCFKIPDALLSELESITASSRWLEASFRGVPKWVELYLGRLQRFCSSLGSSPSRPESSA
ncbi:hypothetical protein Sango_2675100 [Sesamum angolense]|uniref:Uncharacterized protein n=1 Tax=Sesamum angolense TaxID=2727404 RepID=A0AAE1W2G2_9LAMI|nr:hypothetical protein Sango_2675100 [Sesamum angolense]